MGKMWSKGQRKEELGAMEAPSKQSRAKIGTPYDLKSNALTSGLEDHIWGDDSGKETTHILQILNFKQLLSLDCAPIVNFSSLLFLHVPRDKVADVLSFVLFLDFLCPL